MSTHTGRTPTELFWDRMATRSIRARSSEDLLRSAVLEALTGSHVVIVAADRESARATFDRMREHLALTPILGAPIERVLHRIRIEYPEDS